MGKVSVNRLVVADDLALTTNSEKEAISQTDDLLIIAEITRLQISYSKTKALTNSKQNQQCMETKIGKIKNANIFKYLGGIITTNRSGKKAYENRNFFKTEFFNEKYLQENVSVNAKLRHYNTVSKPIILYGTETSTLTN